MIPGEKKYLSNGFLARKRTVCWQFLFNNPFNDHSCPREIIDNKYDVHLYEYTEILPKKIHYHVNCTDCPIEWVVFTTGCSKKTTRFANSVLEKGIPLTVLGLNTVWKQIWGDRIRWFYDYLLTTDPEKLIIWSDTDDIYLVPGTNVTHFIERYHQKTKIVFAAEQACYPNIERALEYPFVNSPFKYLNAGFMIGKSKNIRNLIDTYYRGDCQDDQQLWTEAFLESDLIELDYYNNFALALYNTKISDFDFLTNGTLQVKSTKGQPLVIHGSGGQKVKMLLERIISTFDLIY